MLTIFTYIVNLVFIICLFTGISNAQSLADKIYSKEEVTKNVLDYVYALSEKKFTKADYKYYDGPYAEMESALETWECDMKYGSIKSTDCQKYLHNSIKNSMATESIYYRELKKKLQLDIKNVTVTKIEEKRGAYYVTAKVTQEHNNIRLLIVHRLNPKHKEWIGLLSIVKINGLGVRDYFTQIPSYYLKKTK